jgi:DNA-binding NarL/FixJ family response regulator
VLVVDDVPSTLQDLKDAGAVLVVSGQAERPGGSRDSALASRFATLTPREREVVAALAAGLDITDVARRLGVARVTVMTHVHHAMAKVDAHTQAQLVAYALRAGLPPREHDAADGD